MAAQIGEVIGTGQPITALGEVDQSNPEGAPRLDAAMATELGHRMMEAFADSIRDESAGTVNEQGEPERIDGTPYPELSPDAITEVPK